MKIIINGKPHDPKDPEAREKATAEWCKRIHAETEAAKGGKLVKLKKGRKA